MRKLVVSTDPYHQQYVPIERVRRLARLAEDALGADRVQVRWRDWLAGGFDTGDLPSERRRRLFADWTDRGRDRLNGRAADVLAPSQQLKGLEEFVDLNCGEALLRSKHVHVTPDGVVLPGTCAGIVLGRAGEEPIASMWRRLEAGHRQRPVVGRLAEQGPAGLLELAEPLGFEPAEGYASKCHLCWHVRRLLFARGVAGQELGPAWLYKADESARAANVGSARDVQ
jgi:hypothetical protein